MFSKTPLQKLSLGVAGAIWLALGSVESANAASFKGFSTVSINQPLELASIRLGGNARKNSSDDIIKAALITGSVLVLVGIALGLFDQGNNQKSSDNRSDARDVFKILKGSQVNTKSSVLAEAILQKAPTPVPTPALLPGLLALGWKVMQKRRSEQSGML